MFENIFHEQGTPAERPLDLTSTNRQIGPTIVRRRIRRDPALPPGDEIYDRARIIFSRARRSSGSRATNMF